MTDSQLLEPYLHVARLKSKDLRGLFIDSVNTDWLQLPSRVVQRVKEITAKLHNASLLVDDLEDGSELRRGEPAAHTVYGAALTMNAANLVYFLALQELQLLADDVFLQRQQLDHQEDLLAPSVEPPLKRQASETQVNNASFSSSSAAFHAQVQEAPTTQISRDTIAARLTAVFTSEMVSLHQGQGKDIFWRETVHCPTFEEYDAMVKQKTGGLFRMIVRLLLECAKVLLPEQRQSVLAHVEAELNDVCGDLGILFQILDDLLNLKSDEYHEKKSFCDDLTEGKFSWLVIHSIQTAVTRRNGDTRLLLAMRHKPAEKDKKLFCLSLMQETGSFAACRDRLQSLSLDVKRRIASIHATFLTGRPSSSFSEEGNDASLPSAKLEAYVTALMSKVPAVV